MKDPALRRLARVALGLAESSHDVASKAGACVRATRDCLKLNPPEAERAKLEREMRHYSNVEVGYSQLAAIYQLNGVVAHGFAAIAEAIRDSAGDVPAPEPGPSEDVESQPH